jgi:hypothetical protein
VRVHVLLREPPRRASQPGLDDHFLKVLEGDPVQAHQDRRVAVEVRCGEEDIGIIGKQRRLRPEMLDPRPQDRSGWSGFAEGTNVRGP